MKSSSESVVGNLATKFAPCLSNAHIADPCPPSFAPCSKSRCFISGRFDIVTSFEDGSYGVIDFKTGNPNKDHDVLYGRQLRAYSYALENSADGALGLTPISKLGLLYFPPVRTKQDKVEQLLYESDIHWVEVEKDDGQFLNFLDELSE